MNDYNDPFEQVSDVQDFDWNAAAKAKRDREIAESDEETYYTLPEKRHRLTVVYGGISQWHIVHCSTFRASRHPGRWTRRAADRQALCGALRACLVGVDATDWSTERPIIDIAQVTCKRCLRSYDAWMRRISTTPG